MDISTLCRSCMKEESPWEKWNLDDTTIDMFSFCTNIKITQDDKLPKKICDKCFIKIESAYTFIKEAQKSHVTLKNIVSRTNTSIIVETDSQKNCCPNITNNIKESDAHCIEENALEESIKSGSENCKEDQIDSLTDVKLEDPGESYKLEIEVPSLATCEEQKRHSCPICRKRFTFPAWLERHLAKEHVVSEFACDKCPKTFSKRHQLSSHSACHSELRSFACGVCDARFKRRKQVTAHARTHTDVKPFHCECGMKFKDKGLLKSHMTVHNTEKAHLCSICGWTFHQSNNLTVHMRTHTGAKPYACNKCSFKCSIASSLRRHQLRHTGVALHSCRHCTKHFYDASGLARHTRTHTGELPYKCPFCSRAFVDSWKRKTHLMRHHGMALGEIPRLPPATRGRGGADS